MEDPASNFASLASHDDPLFGPGPLTEVTSLDLEGDRDRESLSRLSLISDEQKLFSLETPHWREPLSPSFSPEQTPSSDLTIERSKLDLKVSAMNLEVAPDSDRRNAKRATPNPSSDDKSLKVFHDEVPLSQEARQRELAEIRRKIFEESQTGSNVSESVASFAIASPLEESLQD